MSPIGSNRGSKTKAPNNIYTAILGVAFGAVLATAAFVTFKCHQQYETLFSASKPRTSNFRGR
jgi:hypothetical protein